jgi:hypothetical protein
MTSRTNHHAEWHDQSGNLPAPLSALQRRRQDAVKRYLDGDPIEAICRELGCSKSWLYKWKTRYEASEPTWSQERSRRPRTTPTKTPAAVAMAIVGLRETLSPGVSAQVIVWKVLFFLTGMVGYPNLGSSTANRGLRTTAQ